jgi:ABC-type transport system involved in multi-copper enzyme maturation permease subunit
VTALFAGELRRVLARRMVRVLALLAVAAIAVAGVLTFLNTEHLTTAELQARRDAAAARREACMATVSPSTPGSVQVRGQGQSPPPVDPAAKQEFCRFTAGHVDDARFKLRSLKGILQGTTAPLVVVAWLIGASVIGSDWQSRTITTILTWEPRRVRVLLAKVVSCIVVATVFAVVAQALLAGALLPSAYLHGTTAGTGGTWLRSVFGVLGRGTLLVAIATAVGFSVASIGRNTAAALGIGFAYFLVVENVVGNFLEDFRRWLVLGNAIVLVSGENSGGEVSGRSVVAAGVYLTAVGLVLLAVATTVFRRRDVA